MLDIPVMHDDQHGTAVVVLAALLNASKYVGMQVKNDTVGMVGLGAAGIGISKLLMAFGVRKMFGADINPGALEIFAKEGGKPVTLPEIMASADIVICTTGVPGLIKKEMIRKGQVILALSNPRPEISPRRPGRREPRSRRTAGGQQRAGVPGVFRGALNARAHKINNRMKIAAAKVISASASAGELVPSILDREMHAKVAEAVERTAFETASPVPARKRSKKRNPRHGRFVAPRHPSRPLRLPARLRPVRHPRREGVRPRRGSAEGRFGKHRRDERRAHAREGRRDPHPRARRRERNLRPRARRQLLDPSATHWLALVGGAVFLGHIFPVYLRFKGGKGVAVALASCCSSRRRPPSSSWSSSPPCCTSRGTCRSRRSAPPSAFPSPWRSSESRGITSHSPS